MNSFYVGYLPNAPKDIAKKVRRLVAGLIATAVAAGALAVVAQQPFSPAVFEYTKVRPFEGMLEASPHPTLVVARPSGAGESRYLLVGMGKHGVGDDVRQLTDHAVRLDGKLIYRAEGTAIEVMPGTMQLAAATPAPASSPKSLGRVQLTGEIVDSKCFLGVMNPGRSKAHRDCAVRCISGRIPPALLVESAGNSRLYLLADASGNALPTRAILARVAEPVLVTGELQQRGDSYTILASSIERK